MRRIALRRRCVPVFFATALALAGAVALAHAARADVFCVTNVAELDEAFDEAGLVKQADIRVASGSYLLVTTLAHHPDPGLAYSELTFSGGWDSTCQHQTRGAALTVLDGHGDHGASLRDEQWVRLDNLTLRSFGAFVIQAEKGHPDPARIYVRNLAVVRSAGFRVEGDLDMDCDPERVRVWIASSLFVQGSESPAIEVTACGGEVELNQVTVAANPGLGVLLHSTGRDYGSTFHLGVFNSIFWGNQRPLSLTTDGGAPGDTIAMMSFDGNVGQDFWSDFASELLLGESNHAGDPHLGADFRPLLGSPAIDVGATPNELWGMGFIADRDRSLQASDFDLDGRNRFLGPRPDAGAFEQSPRCGH
ncbi:MAG: hypothetical protein U0X73_17060 [Thermoanaerobaculia bacterium]